MAHSKREFAAAQRIQASGVFMVQYIKQMILLLKSRRHKGIFSRIYNANSWGGANSVSGPGSEESQTTELIREIPLLLETIGATTLLDIPCGDFHWMKNVDLKSVSYTGAEIVDELVERNQERYGSATCQFISRNLLSDSLPQSDVVLCRDCLVHFSNQDVKIAISNIKKSKSTYLLTTTFMNRGNPKDIATGQWRPIDLMAPPFCFPPPKQIINERCSENAGAYHDKSLALWLVEELPFG